MSTLNLFLKAVSRLPLSWLHAGGAALGWIVYLVSRPYAVRLSENLQQSGLFASGREFRRLRRAAIAEAGKAMVEPVAIWFKSDAEVARLVREVRNSEAIDAARRQGRGIFILTPHMGCFEIVGFHFGQLMPFTVLYRPPNVRFLEPLMINGRRRGQVELAATGIGGVRRLFRALRSGKGAGMLPDQAPRWGEAVWARFFDRPALTTTLSNRLRRATGCATFMVFAERLPRGAGYRLHVEPLHDAVADETQLNQAVEGMIRLQPAQYLWAYDRYKVPGGGTARVASAPRAAR
jgi:KDO2-lipid IV(A) lauroyltransferase